MAVGVAVGTGTVVATPLVLSAAGFTAAGVAAGSVAAAAQSVLYGGGVATGSVFAALQSAGVAGISMTGYAAIGGTAGTAGVLAKKAGEKWLSRGKHKVSLDDQNNITSNQNNKEPGNTMAMDHPDNKTLNSSL